MEAERNDEPRITGFLQTRHWVFAESRNGFDTAFRRKGPVFASWMEMTHSTMAEQVFETRQALADLPPGYTPGIEGSD
jgi:hypothetical protein